MFTVDRIQVMESMAFEYQMVSPHLLLPPITFSLCISKNKARIVSHMCIIHISARHGSKT